MYGAAFFAGGASPDARRSGVQRVGQARGADRAAEADLFRRADLAQRGAHRRDREEKFGIVALAGSLKHPVGRGGGVAGSALQRAEEPADPVMVRLSRSTETDHNTPRTAWNGTTRDARGQRRGWVNLGI
jgi:hypothetical protein